MLVTANQMCSAQICCCCLQPVLTSLCGWMQEQTGDSVLQCGGLLQARLCADGKCGGHLQEGRWHLCQVSHGLPAGYALPSQSWHHCSLWIWCSSDSQQVGAASFQLHNRHPDLSSSFQICALHVILSALLQLMPHCQNCCGTGHTVHTAVEHVRLSKLVTCKSPCQQCCISYAFNTSKTHNTVSTMTQQITFCHH